MKERLFKIMSTILDINTSLISEDTSMSDIEGWDSLKHMNLIFALEEDFNVKFTDEEIVKMTSVKMLLESLKKHSSNS